MKENSCSRKGLSPYLFPLLLFGFLPNVEDKRIEEIINQLMIAAVVFAGAEINCCNDDEAEERIKEQEKSPWNLECFF